MSVINTSADYLYARDPICSVCGEKPEPPYLFWHGTDVCFCGNCCVEIEKGLIADLIQLSAIVRLQKLYPNLTLDRISRAELERQEREKLGLHKNLVTIHNKKSEDA